MFTQQVSPFLKREKHGIMTVTCFMLTPFSVCQQEQTQNSLFPTAGPVGFQSLGLGLGRGDLQPSKSGMEPWNPGTLEPWNPGTLRT